ncbi:Uncharacterised protein [Mycobacterium xenopi]|nr:Uncharacterised protein [Mycobacterium xenopi]
MVARKFTKLVEHAKKVGWFAGDAATSGCRVPGARW